MEPIVKTDKPYEGKGDAPEGQRKMNIGDYYNQMINHQRFFETIPNEDNQKRSLQLAHQVSQNRHRALMEWYSPRFQMDSIIPDGRLGKGTFGKVWKVRFPRTEVVALKQVENAITPEDLWKERDVLILLKHKRIVNLMGAFFDGQMFFVFELCLFSLDVKIASLQEKNKVRFMIQLLEAVEWMHSKNVVHCDLKTDNILITTSNNLVVADFGAALVLENDTDVIKCRYSRGFFGYQDLESNRDFTYCKMSDIFSMGCIVYEIWTGQFLLRYNHKFDNLELERNEYITALQSGKIHGIGSLKYPYQDAPRVTLTERLRRNCPRLIQPISLMTALVRKDRETAGYFLRCETIQGERNMLEREHWNLDNGDDYTTTDSAVVDGIEEFKYPPPSTNVQNAAFAGIYYDEMDVVAQNANPVLGKSLLSYETHVISNFMVRHRLQSILLPGLASKDPAVLGATQMRILMELVSGLVGRNESFPADASQVDVGYQIEQVEEAESERNQRSVRPCDGRPVNMEEQDVVVLDGSPNGPDLTQTPATTITSTAADYEVITEHTTMGLESLNSTTSLPLKELAPAISEKQGGRTKKSQDRPPVNAPANDGNIFGAPLVIPRQQLFKPPPPSLPKPSEHNVGPLDWPVPPFLPPNMGGVVPDCTLVKIVKDIIVPPSTGVGSKRLTPRKHQNAGAAPRSMTLRPGEGKGDTAPIQSLKSTNMRQRPDDVPNVSSRITGAKNRRANNAVQMFNLAPPSDSAIDPAIALVKPPLNVGQIPVAPFRRPDVGIKFTTEAPASSKGSSRRVGTQVDESSKTGESVGISKSLDGRSKSKGAKLANGNKGKGNTKDGLIDEKVKLKEKNTKIGKRDNDQEEAEDDVFGGKKKKRKESSNESKSTKRGNESSGSEDKDSDTRGRKHKLRTKSVKEVKETKRSDASTDDEKPARKKVKKSPEEFSHECPVCGEKFVSLDSCQVHIDNECEKIKQRKEAKRIKKALKEEERNKIGK